jgi:hypothetical protein
LRRFSRVHQVFTSVAIVSASLAVVDGFGHPVQCVEDGCPPTVSITWLRDAAGFLQMCRPPETG